MLEKPDMNAPTPGKYGKRPTTEELNRALTDDRPVKQDPSSKAARVAEILRGGGAKEPGQPAAAPAADREEVDGAPVGDPSGDTGSPDEPGADSQASEAGEGGEGSPDEPLTIEAVADKLGLTKDELNKAQVRVGSETLTLGELKAKLPAIMRLDNDRAEFDDRVGTWELTKIDTERQIMAVVDAFPPGSVPASVLRAVEARHNETRNREAGMLHSARPQWGDPKYAAAQREAMTKVMQRYGFTAAELSTVIDHRYVLAMQDFAALSAKLDALKAAGKRVSEPEVKPGANKAANGQETNKPGGFKRTQQAARVAGILGRR